MFGYFCHVVFSTPSLARIKPVSILTCGLNEGRGLRPRGCVQEAPRIFQRCHPPSSDLTSKSTWGQETASLSLVLQTWEPEDCPSEQLCLMSTYPLLLVLLSPLFSLICWMLNLFGDIYLVGRRAEQLSWSVSPWAYLTSSDNTKPSLDCWFYILFTSVKRMALFFHPFLLLTTLSLGPPAVPACPWRDLKWPLRAILSRHGAVSS